MTEIEVLDVMGKYASYAVTTFVAAGAGAYLGSYLKKKGENLATHEDIGKLVDQMKAVTQATKEIEAKISNEVWSRQKRWEVQQAALLESLKELASSEAFLWSLVHAYGAMDGETEQGIQLRKDASEKYMTAINAFWRTQLATAIVCGKNISDALEKVDRLMAMVRNKAIQGNAVDIWGKWFEEVQVAKRELGSAIRKELQFESAIVEALPNLQVSIQ